MVQKRREPPLRSVAAAIHGSPHIILSSRGPATLGPVKNLTAAILAATNSDTMQNKRNVMTIQELLKALQTEEPLCPPVELPPVELPPVEQPSVAPMKEQKRCGCCKKKLALSDFTCDKCQTRFCMTHRLPEEHACSHDFKAAGKNQLTKQLVAAVADKVGDRI